VRKDQNRSGEVTTDTFYFIDPNSVNISSKQYRGNQAGLKPASIRAHHRLEGIRQGVFG
jgi:hypothetical protein